LNSKHEKIETIVGDHFVDDRGKIIFYNNLPLINFKRFYFVSNHMQNFVRAWHGHKNELKAVSVVQGSAQISVVMVDNWSNPSKNLEIKTVFLTSEKPQFILIPPGSAHGLKTLSANTELLFFSSSSVEESINDDYRFKFDYWNPWEINYR
jgi:dTDP-4-dehydrorhamnose 3,5-epimerase-like enzyme